LMESSKAESGWFLKRGGECPSRLKLGDYFVPVRGDYDGSETSFR
jgi:hypothetical protein